MQQQQQQQSIKPSFLPPPPPYPCDNNQQFMQQMSLNPYQEIFYNSSFLLQQQQQPTQMNLQQQQQQPQQSFISMCLQDPQMIQSQQLIQNPQISQSIQPQQQQQIPFLFPSTTIMQEQHQEQNLETLTAQVAALLYSDFTKIEGQQQLPFSLPEISQTQSLLQGPFLENNNIVNNGNNNNNNNSKNTFEQHNLLNGLDPSQFISLQNSSLLDYLAQLTQPPNDQNVSLAAAALAAAQIIQNSSDNSHIISPCGEVPTTVTAATTPELQQCTSINPKSQQKQTSDTQLNSKPSNQPHNALNSLEKHAFSPVDAQNIARTSSPRSSVSRISNSQIQNHQPFDHAGYPPREQKTLPIVFLQHPQLEGNIQNQQKGKQQSDNNNNNNNNNNNIEIEEKLENSKNQISHNNVICGITSKQIKKRKKPLSQLKAHQFPSQSSDLSTNSQSLQINFKKNEQNMNSILSKEIFNSNANTVTFNAYSALNKDRSTGIQATQSVDQQNNMIPLSKDTTLFNDLLDPLILFLKENSQGETIKKDEQKMTRNNVNQPQAQKKQTKQSISRKSKTVKRQDTNESIQHISQQVPICQDDCLTETSKQVDDMHVEIIQQQNLAEEQEIAPPQQQQQEQQYEEHKQSQSQKSSGQKQNQQNQEHMTNNSEEHEVEEEKQEHILDNQLFPLLQVPSSPESIPLAMNKMVRISPRRRVCSNETRDESDHSNNASLNSLPKCNQEKNNTHNNVSESIQQSHITTPIKKLHRLKRISQIAEERREKPSKINLKNTSTTAISTVGLPHRSQTAFEERKNNSLMVSPSKPSLLKTRNQSKIIHEITNPSQSSAENNNATNVTFSNMDLFSEATQVIMNQFEKHYLKCMIHSNSQIRINEFKTFMKNARKNDELIGLLLNPRACPFSSSFVDFLRLPAIKWIRKSIDPKKQLIYFELIQIFKSEDRGVSGLRPRRDRNLMSNFALSK